MLLLLLLSSVLLSSETGGRNVLVRNLAPDSGKCQDKTLCMAAGCRHVFHNFPQSAYTHATTVFLKQAITTSLHTLPPSRHSTVYTDKILNCCTFLATPWLYFTSTATNIHRAEVQCIHFIVSLITEAMPYTKPASAGTSDYIEPNIVPKRTLEFAADTSWAAASGSGPILNFFVGSPSKGGPDKNLYTKSEIVAVAE